MEVKKHEKEYLIRTYEVDKDGNMRIITLFNIFQDMADEHAESLGVGLTFCKEKGFAWVGTNYHIKIKRMPKIHEKVKVSTWPTIENKLSAVRDFAIYDSHGEMIVAGSSVWVLIDYARRRPLLLRANLPEYNRISERAIEADFSKLPEVVEPTGKIDFRIRFDDIDLNNHVNNAVYPLWATEGVDAGFHKEHMVAELEVEFKKEGLLGERVVVETLMNGDESLHSIKCAEDGRELSRARIKWKK